MYQAILNLASPIIKEGLNEVELKISEIIVVKFVGRKTAKNTLKEAALDMAIVSLIGGLIIGVVYSGITGSLACYFWSIGDDAS